MNNSENPIANPYVVLREEFDDWAILFNPDTGHGFGLSPTSVYLWKLLDGKHLIDALLKALRRDALDVPQEAGEHLFAFVEELTEHGLAGYGEERTQSDKGHPPPRRVGASDLAPADEKEDLVGHSPPDKPLVYARPCLVSFSDAERAEGATCNPAGSHATTASCTTGNYATGHNGCVSNGLLATGSCSTTGSSVV